MAENTEIMDKLKDNGLSEEVNRRTFIIRCIRVLSKIRLLIPRS